MSTLPTLIENYLEYCKYQKRLDSKTLKAYRIDLRQFSEQLCSTDVADITQFTLETYITTLSFSSSSMLALERTFFNAIYASYTGTVPSKYPLSYASLFLISFRFKISERFSAYIPPRFLTI